MGVSEESRDEKMRLLYSIIESHVGYSVSCTVHLEPLKRIFGNMKWTPNVGPWIAGVKV